MRATAYNQRLQRGQAPSYQRLQAHLAREGSDACQPQSIHCGWGRLLIGHTYPDAASLAAALQEERPGERDIALYVAAPQQVLAQAPQQLFLDPSDTLRLWFNVVCGLAHSKAIGKAVQVLNEPPVTSTRFSVPEIAHRQMRHQRLNSLNRRRVVVPLYSLEV